MDLLRSGNRGKLLEIETKDVILCFSGDLTNRKFNSLGINKNTPATILVKGADNESITLRTITNYEGLVNNSGITMMPCFFEDGQYQLIIPHLGIFQSVYLYTHYFYL